MGLSRGKAKAIPRAASRALVFASLVLSVCALGWLVACPARGDETVSRRLGGIDSAAGRSTPQPAPATPTGAACAASLGQAPVDWPLVHCDAFDDNSGVWDVGDKSNELGTLTRSVANGVYQWDMDVRKTVRNSAVATLSPLAGLYAAVDARLTSGSPAVPEFGLVLDSDDSATTYFYFASETRGVALWYFEDRDMKQPIAWTPIAALRPGDVNRLGIMVVGPQIRLYANGQPVAEFKGRSAAGWRVAVSAQASQPGRYSVQFDKFEIREAPPGATLEPLPTATLPAQVCAPSPQSAPSEWPVALCDPFDDNRNQWELRDDRDTAYGTLFESIGGTYACQFEARNRFFWPEELLSPEASTFYASVEGKRESRLGNTGYGLLFRYLDPRNYFAFVVYDAQQKYEVMININGDKRRRIQPTVSRALRPNESNRLAVKAEHWHFTFYINDQRVAELDDIHYKSGLVGVFLLPERSDKGTIDFDNFELRKPEG